jgi:hypothetical protein
MQRAKPYFKPNPDKPNLWTVMLYMAGDNNLDNFGISDLREIKRVGSSDQVQIVAEFDRSGPDLQTKRYWLHSDDVVPKLRDDVLEEFAETDSGSPDQLTRFILWGIENFPAQHYFVIIWAHGAGAFDEDFYYSNETRLRPRILRRGIFGRRVPTNTSGDTELDNSALTNLSLIAPDDDARSFIDNVELKTALANVGRKIEILGMDACLMSMLEICFQLRESIGITIASEAQEPLEGWPYEGFLKRMTQNPKMGPAEVATAVVDEFVKLYEDYENSATTLAACDLQNCLRLIEPLRRLTEFILANIDDTDIVDAIMLTRYLVRSDDLIEVVDLYDLCELLMTKSKNNNIISHCREVIRGFDNSGAIINRQPLTGEAEHWHGLSIYFPTFEVSQKYKLLDLIQGPLSNWEQFIDTYVGLSGR